MEYKIITIHSKSVVAPGSYTQGSELINEYVQKGWVVENMCSTAVKGELAILLKRETKQLLNG